jgi:hypothetical protein
MIETVCYIYLTNITNFIREFSGHSMKPIYEYEKFWLYNKRPALNFPKFWQLFDTSVCHCTK